MNILVNNIRLQFTEQGKAEIVLSTDLNRVDISALKEVIAKGKELAVDINKYSPKRSKEANRYCWKICQKISEIIRSTKEDVYKKAIREVGQFEIVPIKNEAVERWIEAWKGKGIGWFAEVLDDSKHEGYKKVISYFGSSCYNIHEMSVLIDNIVQDAKELGIETMTSEELSILKNNWRD